MTEKGIQFFAEMSSNAELKKKIDEILTDDEKESIKKTIPIAKEFGFDLTEEDLTPDQTSFDGKMEDDELDAVAGGAAYTDAIARVRPDDEICCLCLTGTGGRRPKTNTLCEMGVENR